MVHSVLKEYRKWKVQFKRELVVAILILTLPFLIYVHLLFSDNSQDFGFLFWKWGHGYKNNQLFVWNFLSDLIPLCLLIIAFISSISYIRFYIIPFIITFFYFLLSDLFFLDPAFFFTRIEGYLFAILIFLIVLKLDNLVLNKIRINLLTFSSKDFLRELIALRYTRILENIEKTTRGSDNITTLQYISRLHFYNELIQKAIEQSQKSKKQNINWLSTRFSKLLVIACLVFSLFLNFVYLAIPEEVSKIKIGLLAINDLGFGSLSDLAWYTLKKVSLLIVFVIWFSTSKNWWKIAILSPLLIYLFQLTEVFYEVDYIETYLKTSVIALVIFLSLTVLILSRIVRLKTKILDYLDLTQNELNKEITRLSKLNFD